MNRLVLVFILAVLIASTQSIPTSFAQSKVLNNIFKQIHNKKAVREPNYFVIV
uniref:Cystatin domain-containing protein n=1 Tax=Heterorhabditis bacteriophora TaxID=37862 RepID=A0A1I7WVA6_HETBA